VYFIHLTNQLNNYTEQSPSSEADSRYGTQRFITMFTRD